MTIKLFEITKEDTSYDNITKYELYTIKNAILYAKEHNLKILIILKDYIGCTNLYDIMVEDKEFSLKYIPETKDGVCVLGKLAWRNYDYYNDILEVEDFSNNQEATKAYYKEYNNHLL